MISVGFTGTRKGMTENQMWGVVYLLGILKPEVVHHGDCVGADEEFHKICYDMPCSIHIHPSTNVSMSADCSGDYEEKPKPPLVRNQDIVDSCHVLIAAPEQDYEIQRSGTWSTVRKARSAGKKVYVVFLDGGYFKNNE